MDCLKRKLGKTIISQLKKMGLPSETEYIFDYNNNDTHYIELRIEKDITFDMLQQLSDLLETKDINITSTEHGYYGDVTDSHVRITLGKRQIEKFFYTAKETEQMDKQNERSAKNRRRQQAINEAKRLGVKPKDLE